MRFYVFAILLFQAYLFAAIQDARIEYQGEIEAQKFKKQEDLLDHSIHNVEIQNDCNFDKKCEMNDKIQIQIAPNSQIKKGRQQKKQKYKYLVTQAGECQYLTEESVEVNLDNESQQLTTSTNQFSYFETMSDIDFPSGLLHSNSDKESTSLQNNLFQSLFNPPTFIFSKQIFTLMETTGEIKINNQSDCMTLQIVSISQDSDILSIERNQDDLLPQKQRTLLFTVIPTETKQQQEVNLFFKIRVFDSKKIKEVSTHTLQYSIFLQNVKENKFGMSAINIQQMIKVGEKYISPIRFYNPTSNMLRISQIIALKRQLFLQEDQNKDIISRKTILFSHHLENPQKWQIESDSESEYAWFLINSNFVGFFSDTIKILFTDSDLSLQIPVFYQIIANSIQFSKPFYHMGVISNQNSHNSRTLEIDNNSEYTIEIQGIQIQFDYSSSCIAVETFQQNIKGEREPFIIIIKPHEKNKVIGKLKLMDSSLNTDTIFKVFSGKILLFTNSSSSLVEAEFKFYKNLKVVEYSSESTQFFVGETSNVYSAIRKIELKNVFSSKIKVTELIIPQLALLHFDISGFNERIIESKESKPLMRLRRKEESQYLQNEQQLNTYVLLKINKDILIPIFISVYDMNISCQVPQSDQYESCQSLMASNYIISFGNKAITKSRYQISEFLKLKNSNPTPLKILKIRIFGQSVELNICSGKIFLKIIPNDESKLDQNQSQGEEGIILLQAYQELQIQVVLLTELESRSTPNHDRLEIITEFETIKFPIEYYLFENQIIFQESEISFTAPKQENNLIHQLVANNPFQVNLKVVHTFITNPRFQFELEIEELSYNSTSNLGTIRYNPTFDYEHQLKQNSEENYVSVDEIAAYQNHNISNYSTQNQRREITGQLCIEFDVTSICLDLHAEKMAVRLLIEEKIEFKNREIRSFSQKQLSFINPLDSPISFQLFIAPSNILKLDRISNTKFTSEAQKDSDILFCIPVSSYAIPIVKDIFDRLSDFFVDQETEQLVEISDLESLRKMQTHPDLDRSTLPFLYQIMEGMKLLSLYKLEDQSTSQSNLSGYLCKKGIVNISIKKWIEKSQFIKSLVEFFLSPQKELESIQLKIKQINDLKKEDIEISSLSRQRPNLLSFPVRQEKTFWEKILLFIKKGFLAWKSEIEEKSQIANWFQISTQKENTDEQTFSKQEDPQQFFLSREVVNKILTLQPKQQLTLNSLIYLPTFGEASMNLIIKSNVSDIDIIQLVGSSGIGKLQIIDIKDISPLMLVNKTSQVEKDHQIYIKQQISNGIFLFKMREREIESSRSLGVDILKNFIIKNTGNYAISIKNIYLESQPCRAYGFYILGCVCVFKLEPGDERIVSIGYKSDWYEDTISKNVYFYTESFKFHFKIKLETQQTYPIDSRSKTISALTLSPELKQYLTEKQKFPMKNYEEDDNEKNQVERSQDILKGIIETLKKVSEIEGNNHKIEDKAQGIENWLKFNYRAVFSQCFVITVIFITALFVLYTFANFFFFFIEVLKLGQKQVHEQKNTIQEDHEHISQQQKESIEIQSVEEQEEEEEQLPNLDISSFEKEHTLNQSILLLNNEFRKIKEHQEKFKLEQLNQKKYSIKQQEYSSKGTFIEEYEGEEEQVLPDLKTEASSGREENESQQLDADHNNSKIFKKKSKSHLKKKGKKKQQEVSDQKEQLIAEKKEVVDENTNFDIQSQEIKVIHTLADLQDTNNQILNDIPPNKQEVLLYELETERNHIKNSILPNCTLAPIQSKEHNDTNSIQNNQNQMKVSKITQRNLLNETKIIQAEKKEQKKVKRNGKAPSNETDKQGREGAKAEKQRTFYYQQNKSKMSQNGNQINHSNEYEHNYQAQNNHIINEKGMNTNEYIKNCSNDSVDYSLCYNSQQFLNSNSKTDTSKSTETLIQHEYFFFHNLQSTVDSSLINTPNSKQLNPNQKVQFKQIESEEEEETKHCEKRRDDQESENSFSSGEDLSESDLDQFTKLNSSFKAIGQVSIFDFSNKQEDNYGSKSPDQFHNSKNNKSNCSYEYYPSQNSFPKQWSENEISSPESDAMLPQNGLQDILLKCNIERNSDNIDSSAKKNLIYNVFDYSPSYFQIGFFDKKQQQVEEKQSQLQQLKNISQASAPISLRSSNSFSPSDNQKFQQNSLAPSSSTSPILDLISTKFHPQLQFQQYSSYNQDHSSSLLVSYNSLQFSQSCEEDKTKSYYPTPSSCSQTQKVNCICPLPPGLGVPEGINSMNMSAQFNSEIKGRGGNQKAERERTQVSKKSM